MKKQKTKKSKTVSTTQAENLAATAQAAVSGIKVMMAHSLQAAVQEGPASGQIHPETQADRHHASLSEPPHPAASHRGARSVTSTSPVQGPHAHSSAG